MEDRDTTIGDEKSFPQEVMETASRSVQDPAISTARCPQIGEFMLCMFVSLF